MCAHVIRLFDSGWNIDLAQSSEGSNKIVLKLLILKMTGREILSHYVFEKPVLRKLDSTVSEPVERLVEECVENHEQWSMEAHHCNEDGI